MRPLFSFRAPRYVRRVGGGDKMAAGCLWRRLCQVGCVAGEGTGIKAQVVPNMNVETFRMVIDYSGKHSVLLEGSAFPVNYANRIMQKQCFLPHSDLMGVRLAGSHVHTQEPKTNPLVSISDEPETLYKRLSLLVKGHDKAVLDSYEYFAVLAAKELGISVEKVHKPPKKIERLTLLKSVHIYKKHRVQYEMRTHYMCLELKHLTSSTAAVYLEYVQRNLPEGVAMEVKKTKIEKIPEHIREPVWDTLPQIEETEVKS